MISTLSGSVADMYAALCAESEIPLITFSPSEKQLVPPAWTFSTNVPWPWFATGYLQWVHDTWDYEGTGRNPKVASVGWDMAFGAAHIDVFEKIAPQLDIDVALVETVPVGTMDMKVTAQRAIEADVDHVFLPLLAGPGASFAKEIYVHDSQMKLAIVYNQWTSLEEIYGESLDGHYAMPISRNWTEDYPMIDRIGGLMDEHFPDGWSKWEEPAMLYVYLAPMAITEGVRKCVEDFGVDGINGTNLLSSLQGLEVDVEGLLSKPLRFGEDQVGVDEVNVWQYEDGDWHFVAGPIECMKEW